MSCGGNLLADLDINDVLSIRDQIGAIKKPVFFVRRTWYTDDSLTVQSDGISGTPKDVVTQMLPTPLIVDLSQSLNLREGGMVKQGDIFLKSVSKQSFKEPDLDGSSTSPNIENLFLVGDKMYQVLSLVESYVTWKVQLRELTNQEKY